MEPLAEAIALRRAGRDVTVLDSIDRQIELVEPWAPCGYLTAVCPEILN